MQLELPAASSKRGLDLGMGGYTALLVTGPFDETSAAIGAGVCYTGGVRREFSFLETAEGACATLNGALNAQAKGLATALWCLVRY